MPIFFPAAALERPAPQAVGFKADEQREQKPSSSQVVSDGSGTSRAQDRQRARPGRATQSTRCISKCRNIHSGPKQKRGP